MFRKQYCFGGVRFLVELTDEAVVSPTLPAFEENSGAPDAVIAPPPTGRPVSVARVLTEGGLVPALLERGAFILHGAYILTDGGAVVFSAPSGVGKSTQAALWRTHRGARIVNGDRVLLRREPTGFSANGVFYNGSSGICDNVTAPLRAVAVLRQAAENTAAPMPGREAFRALLAQCSYDVQSPAQVARVTELAAALVTATPVYSLCCTADERAVAALEQVMKGAALGKQQ